MSIKLAVMPARRWYYLEIEQLRRIRLSPPSLLVSPSPVPSFIFSLSIAATSNHGSAISCLANSSKQLLFAFDVTRHRFITIKGEITTRSRVETDGKIINTFSLWNCSFTDCIDKNYLIIRIKKKKEAREIGEKASNNPTNIRKIERYLLLRN